VLSRKEKAAPISVKERQVQRRVPALLYSSFSGMRMTKGKKVGDRGVLDKRVVVLRNNGEKNECPKGSPDKGEGEKRKSQKEKMIEV